MFAFSLLDTKAGAFGVPFFVAHEAIARRMVSDLVNDPQSSVHRYPEDFSLYRVGSFDVSAGTLKPEAFPVFLVQCVEFLNVRRAIPPGVPELANEGKE